jgi:hypothetical protein
MLQGRSFEQTFWAEKHLEAKMAVAIAATVQRGCLFVRQRPSPRGCIQSQQNQREGLGMKKLVLAGALLLVATGAQAQGTGSNPNSHVVQGHTTSSGTYVQPYVATNPNSTQRDNYSATGNVNPNTGAVGMRNPRN